MSHNIWGLEVLSYELEEEPCKILKGGQPQGDPGIFYEKASSRSELLLSSYFPTLSMLPTF